MAGGRFQHDIGSTGAPYPTRAALDAIAFLPAKGDKAWYLDPASPIGRYEAMWEGEAWGSGYLPNLSTAPGSPSSPFASTAERTAWATANLSTLKPGVSTVWMLDSMGSPAEHRYFGPTAKNWVVVNRSSRKTVAGFGNSIMAANIPAQNGTTTLWAGGIPVSVGNVIAKRYLVFLPGEDRKTIICSVAGITGAIEPAWETYAMGATIVDGTATYTVTDGRLWASPPNAYWVYAQQLSGNPLDEICLVGLSGKKAAEILSYYPRVDLLDPDVVYFGPVFENNVMASSDLQEISDGWATYERYAMDSLAKGRKVIIQTLFPNGYTDSSSLFSTYTYGTASKATTWLNEKIRNLARYSSNVILFEVADLYKDPNPANPFWPDNATVFASPNGTGQLLKMTDGIHPYTCCHWKIAEILAPVLSANFPPTDMACEALNQYAVTYNPAQYGTSGNKSAGVTGNVSNGVSVGINGTGASCVASKVARTKTLRSWLQLALTTSAGNGASTFVQCTEVSLANTKLVVGDTVQAFCEMEYDASESAQVGGRMWVRFNGAASADRDIYTIRNAPSSGQPFGQVISQAAKVVGKSSIATIPPGTTGINIWFETGAAKAVGAVTATTRIGSAFIKRLSPASVLA